MYGSDSAMKCQNYLLVGVLGERLMQSDYDSADVVASDNIADSSIDETTPVTDVSDTADDADDARCCCCRAASRQKSIAHCYSDHNSIYTQRFT